jgi:uncharacterized membrane protein (DUF4010 family)
VALMTGALIGLERERARLAPRQSRLDLPGLRSFGLISLYGGLTGILLIAEGLDAVERILLSALMGIGFLALYAPYAYTRYMKTPQTGVTTLIVMLVAYSTGLLVGLGYIVVGVSTSIAVTLILAVKTPIEMLVARMSYEELIALLEVSTAAIVLGPIVKAYAPVVWGIDLYKVYVFFVIVLAISFTTYAIARVYGAKGLVYSAILGGLVNSEATISSITSFMRAVSDPNERKRIIRSSTILVIASMEVRAAALLIVAAYLFLGPRAGGEAALYSMLATAPSVALAILAYAQASRISSAINVEAESPLNWNAALRSAVTYLVLAAAVKAASGLGSEATVAIGIVGGLANAGAAILSLASAGATAGVGVIIAAGLGAIGSAALNKPLYADHSALSRPETLSLIAWSIVLAIPPLGATALLIAA